MILSIVHVVLRAVNNKYRTVLCVHACVYINIYIYINNQISI